MDKVYLTVFFTILYILGILAFTYGSFLQIALTIIILLIILCLKFKLKTRFAFIGYLFFIVGLFNANYQIHQSDNLVLLENKKVVLEGTISSIPTNNNFNKTNFFVDIDTEKEPEKRRIHKNLNSKIYLTINSDKKILNNFEIGERIQFTGKVKRPYKIGNPNQFDYGEFLKYKNTFTVMYIKDEDCKIIAEPKTLKWKALKELNQIRHKIIQNQSKYFKSPNIEILGGIVFGDDAINPPQDIKKSFITTGILHILAASGMNVAFIFTMMTCILGLLKIPYKTNAIIGAITVLIYAAMTGFPPSIVRAVIMLEFVIIGKLINRQAQPLSLLSFAALIILIFNPSMLFNISFQLSFIVTLGIITFAPIIYEYLDKSGNFYNKLIFLFIPLIAQICVIPLQMYYFQTFSTYSLFANILILPFLSIISFGGFICSIVNLIPYIGDFLTKIFSYILNPSITSLVWISKFFSNINFALIGTYKMEFLQIIFYYTIIIFLYFTVKHHPKSIKRYLLLLLCTALLIISFIKIPNQNFEVVFFDVQNADCILIKSPKNEYFVIDSGKLGYKTSYSQVNNILIPYLKEKRVNKINTFIITHFDADHAGGALDLLNNFKVEHVIYPPNIGNNKLGKEIIEYINQNNINYSIAKNNNAFYKENNFILTNFYINSDNENDSSILTLAQNENYNILFCADTTKDIIKKINLKEKINTIKIGHHGALNTIDRKLIKKLDIKNAIISVGDTNHYNHPDNLTIEELKSANINIYRTDLDNAIKIIFKDNKEEILLYNQEKKNWQQCTRN